MTDTTQQTLYSTFVLLDIGSLPIALAHDTDRKWCGTRVLGFAIRATRAWYYSNFRFAHPQHSKLKALELNSGQKLACSHMEVIVNIPYFRKYHYSQIISKRKCVDKSHFPSLSGPKQSESETKRLKLVARSCKRPAMSSVNEYRLGG